jgi:hypothetical protein
MEIESPDDELSVTLTRAEAGLLTHAAEVGLRAIEAFNLARNTARTEHALNRLRAAVAAAERVQPAERERQSSSKNTSRRSAHADA